VFVCLLGAPPATQAYCGAFRSDSSSTTGRWNFAVHGDSLVGFVAAQDWDFDLGFYAMPNGSGDFNGIAGGIDSTRQVTFYWRGNVNRPVGSASGTWTGFFFHGGVNVENGTWSAEACSPPPRSTPARAAVHESGSPD
jgi:hypothetical protein